MSKKSCISLTPDYTIISTDPETEDTKLVNWKKWLTDRKRHYKVYTTILGRTQDDLLINSSEKFRPLMETRELMEYAADPSFECRVKNFELSYWLSPELLPNHGNPYLPDVEVPSKKKSNKKPEIIHVLSPNLILEEKGLSISKKSPTLKNEYLQERAKELSTNILTLDPNPPEMENLFIQGKNVWQTNKNKRNAFSNIPVICLTTAEETEKETSEWSINHDAMIAALRIEDKDIVRRLNPRFGCKHEESVPYKWDIKFNSTGSQIIENIIFLENRGNIKITYQWETISVTSSWFPNRKREASSFSFNKNKGIIMPGQILKIPVSFQLSQCGIRTEYWKLKTEPSLSSGGFVFRFWGCCSDEDEEVKRNRENKIKEINEHRHCRIRDSAIKEILEEIVHDALTFQPPDPPYRTLFLEAEIFLAKNPSYFYHPSLIVQFREIYNSIFASYNLEWNLSLFDLQKLLLGIEDPEFRQQALSRFIKVCRASLEPNLYKSSKTQKHERVYDLLCSFANQFEIESQYIKNIDLGSREVKTKSSMIESSDQSRSTSFVRNSIGVLKHSKIKSKKKVRKRLLSTSSKEEEKINNNLIMSNPNDVIYYKEVFYLRIYELLGETICKACAVIDSYKRLNEPEK